MHFFVMALCITNSPANIWRVRELQLGVGGTLRAMTRSRAGTECVWMVEERSQLLWENGRLIKFIEDLIRRCVNRAAEVLYFCLFQVILHEWSLTWHVCRCLSIFTMSFQFAQNIQ